MKKEKKVKKDAKTKDTQTPMRQIIIETDGNNINLTKVEVSGKIELIGILQNLIEYLNKQ